VKSILEDINAVIGVTGCFVCTNDGQVLASALPKLFDEAALSDVGQLISKTMAGLATDRRRKVGDIDLVYEQGRLVTKSLKEGCLCILCVRDVNLPLLNLTANVAGKKLAEELNSKVVERPLPRRELKPAGGPPVDAVFFRQLEQHLARAIGPIATLVVDEEIEALGESRESFPWDKATHLIEKVSAQIADEGRRLGFNEAALQALRERRRGDEVG
jgi:predicted regulator of Ras-like GTPase activity (Roadblock/LC7/MglB family)